MPSPEKPPLSLNPMSRYALERLDASHDRSSFVSGLETIDQYLRETARSHTEKGISLTRVLVDADSIPPKRVLGYFTLTPCMIEAAGWPNAPKGLPKNPVGAILLGRLGVSKNVQRAGIGKRLLALARRIAHDSLAATGGIGMVVDAASEELVSYYEYHGFVRISIASRRLFLPVRSLL
jgi:ribosomal protein S18 acetylase RimI-like enzyme